MKDATSSSRRFSRPLSRMETGDPNEPADAISLITEHLNDRMVATE
jgi:hypothetical protein